MHVSLEWTCAALATALCACNPPSSDGLFGFRPDVDAGGAGAGAAGGAGGAAGMDAGVAPGGAAGEGGNSGADGADSGAPRDAGAPDASGDAGPEVPNPLGCAAAAVSDCNALIAALAHRYSFEGSGDAALDSVGGAHGTLEGSDLSGDGAVELSGNGEHVDLPNGIVSALSNATFEAWLVWVEGDDWQRIFDFGTSDEGEDEQGFGEEYVFLSPRADSGNLRATFLSVETGGEVQLDAGEPLPDGAEAHVALVVDADDGTFSLFLNGELMNTVALPGSLADIDDVNNWLGVSQFDRDPALEASILEFRIYDAALSAAQLDVSFDLGPDAALSP